LHVEVTFSQRPRLGLRNETISNLDDVLSTQWSTNVYQPDHGKDAQPSSRDRPRHPIKPDNSKPRHEGEYVQGTHLNVPPKKQRIDGIHDQKDRQRSWFQTTMTVHRSLNVESKKHYTHSDTIKRVMVTCPLDVLIIADQNKASDLSFAVHNISVDHFTGNGALVDSRWHLSKEKLREIETASKSTCVG
jgi:hypothetical protein